MNKFEGTRRRYFQAGEGGGCTWPGGGDAQEGEGGCTCILCIPPGYAPDNTGLVCGKFDGALIAVTLSEVI